MRDAEKKSLLLADPAIRVVLTCLGAALLGWPMLQIAGERGTAVLFVYVFVVWSGLIALLLGVSRSLRRAAGSASAAEAGETTEPRHPAGPVR